MWLWRQLRKKNKEPKIIHGNFIVLMFNAEETLQQNSSSKLPLSCQLNGTFSECNHQFKSKIFRKVSLLEITSFVFFLTGDLFPIVRIILPIAWRVSVFQVSIKVWTLINSIKSVHSTIQRKAFPNSITHFPFFVCCAQKHLPKWWRMHEHKYKQSSNEQRHYTMKYAELQKSLFIQRKIYI